MIPPAEDEVKPRGAVPPPTAQQLMIDAIGDFTQVPTDGEFELKRDFSPTTWGKTRNT